MTSRSFRDLIRSLAPAALLRWHRRRWLQRKKQRERRVVDEFHKLYYPTRIHEANWLGVPALKCPLDCWVYAEIIWETRPDIILETGVKYGGTTLFLASILDLVGHGQVVGVDIDLSNLEAVVRKHQRVHLIEGSSVAPAVLDQLRTLTQGKRVMVILDSDHSARHVLKELDLYGALVSPDCYMVCEDTNLNGHPVFSPEPYSPGPFEAVQEFLNQQPEVWEIDRACERFLMTCNPGGYLKKRAQRASAVE